MLSSLSLCVVIGVVVGVSSSSKGSSADGTYCDGGGRFGD